MERLAMRLQARTGEDSVEYLLKYGQLILTMLGIIGVTLWIIENPRRIRAAGLSVAST